MTARIKIRRDSAANWANANPILAAGELGLDTDANQIKVGDGAAAWADLEFVTSSGGSGFDGNSDLTFGTEDLGFYAFPLPTYTYSWSQVTAVAADSKGSVDTRRVIFAVGDYYDNDNGWLSNFVTKRNADDTEAWTMSYRNTGSGSDSYLTSVAYDSVTDRLYVGGKTWDGYWRCFTMELNPATGAIIGQTLYRLADGSEGWTPQIHDMLIDPSDGSLITTGESWNIPTVNPVTPLDLEVAFGTSQNGTGADPDGYYSLLVVSKADFDSFGFTPETTQGAGEWRLFDLSNPTDGGTGIGRINEFRELDTVTLTGTGSGIKVDLYYDITNARWHTASFSGDDGNPTWEYKIGDTIKVLGSSFGGTDGDDDVVLTISWEYQNPPYDVEFDFVPLYKQNNVNTPPAIVTDYARLWIGGNYSFFDSVGNPAVWGVGRVDSGAGFILTPNSQLSFASTGYWDRMVSCDLYVDTNAGETYIYVGAENNQDGNDGKRAAVYKIQLSDGSQVWAKSIDRVSDGSLPGDYIKSVNCDDAGNVYVVAMGLDANWQTRMAITKLDSDGNIVWQKTQAAGTGEWDSSPIGDLDKNADVFYIGGDNGQGMTFLSVDTASGSVNWSRNIDFSTTDGWFNAQPNDDYAQYVAAGGGRITIGGYSYDYNSTYNGGEAFGVLVGLDADQVNALATDEVGQFGPFTLSTSNVATEDSNGSGTNDITDFPIISSSNLITEVYAGFDTTNNNIAITPHDITRSPYKVENVQSITFADGTVQNTASGGVKHKWDNPYGNSWKMVEWNSAKAVRFNQYDDGTSVYFTAPATVSQVNTVAITENAGSSQWQEYTNAQKANTRIYWGGWWYPVNGSGSDAQGNLYFNITIPPGAPLLDFNQYDNIQVTWDIPESLIQVEWFNPYNSPWGDNNFRGAKIDYHAYSNNYGTMIGTIHYAYDNNEYTQVTHTEHLSGASDLPKMILWEHRDGSLYYRNTTVEEDYVFIQWTATMFYGNETWD